MAMGDISGSTGCAGFIAGFFLFLVLLAYVMEGTQYTSDVKAYGMAGVAVLVVFLLGYWGDIDREKHHKREMKILEREKKKWSDLYEEESKEDAERDMELADFRQKAEVKDMIQRVEKEAEEEWKKGEAERTQKFIDTYGDLDE